MSIQTLSHRPTVTAVATRMRERYLSVFASAALFVVLFATIIVRYDFASPTQVFLNLLVDNAYPVSYTHLTLPTNREV